MARNETHEFVTRELSNWQSVSSHIKDVQEAARDLEDADVYWQIEADYGGDRAVVYVEGYRLLNEEERAAKREAEKAEKTVYEERERAQYERLKEKYEKEES